jgi:hypothetical protein
MCFLCKKTTKTGRNERGLPHSSTAVRKGLLFVYDVSFANSYTVGRSFQRIGKLEEQSPHPPTPREGGPPGGPDLHTLRITPVCTSAFNADPAGSSIVKSSVPDLGHFGTNLDLADPVLGLTDPAPDPDPYLCLTDPDPGGPKSYGSGSGTLVKSI